MKLLDLINLLFRIHNTHGDIEVRTWDEYDGQPVRGVRLIEPKQKKGEDKKPPHVVIE